MSSELMKKRIWPIMEDEANDLKVTFIVCLRVKNGILSMSEPQMQFVLTSKSLRNVQDFCRIKTGLLKIGSKSIKISKELAIFISLDIYLHFKSSNDPYSIDISEFAESDVVKCVNKYVSLTEGADSFEIDEKEWPIMINICEETKNKKLKKQIECQNDGKWPKKISWTTGCLSEYELFQNCREFCFDVCGKAFMCPKILAMLLSTEVCQRSITDATISSLKLSFQKRSHEKALIGAFSSIFELLSGIPLTISVEKAVIFEEIAKEIGNDELLSAIEVFTIGPIDFSNVYNYMRILRIDNQSSRFEEAIEFAATNFYHLDTESLLSVPIQAIEKVLSSPIVRIENEEKLCEFAKLYIERNGPKGIRILSKVKFEFLGSKAMNDIIRVLNIDSVNQEIWAAISNRLKCEVDHCECNVESQRWISQGKSAIASMRIDINALQQKVKEEQEENAKLKNENQIMKRSLENHNMRGENQKMKKKIDETQNEYNRLKSEMNSKQMENQYFQTENASLRNKNQSMKRNIEEMQNEMQATKNENQTLKRTIHILKQKLPNENQSMRNRSGEMISENQNEMREFHDNCTMNGNFFPSLTSKECNYSIQILEGITRIEKGAFKDSKISNIKLPNTLIEIGESAFESCSSLSSITIPPCVTQIGNWAFSGCSCLSSIEIPSSATQIGTGAFNGCSSLSSITIPSSINQIGNCAFCGCYSLTSIQIPRNCLIAESGDWPTFGSNTKVIRK